MNPEQMLVPLRQWEQIKDFWTDQESRDIERDCLEPLDDTVRRLLDTLSRMDLFIRSIERKMDEAEYC